MEEKKNNKKGFWQTMLDILEEANIRVKRLHERAMLRQIDKEIKKDEKKEKV